MFLPLLTGVGFILFYTDVFYVTEQKLFLELIRSQTVVWQSILAVAVGKCVPILAQCAEIAGPEIYIY